MSLKDLLAEKRHEILRLAESHGAINIRLFGSVARGEDRPDSDIDLLVEAAPRHAPFFPGGFKEDMERLLGRKVDVVEPEGLHWYIKDRILREARPL
jgi:predicted nucleotidyltransferase